MGVIDIRGTHGSGKSWIVHQLLHLFPHQAIVGGGCEHLGYHLPDVDCAVLGSYERVCGGCDGIKTADEVVRRVRLFAGMYQHVLLEGILVAHTFKRYSELATELKDYGYTFFFLDTPLETCLTRVNARRAVEGKGPLADPKNVVKDWHSIWEAVQGKCRAVGHDVEVLNHEYPLPQVIERLGYWAHVM